MDTETLLRFKYAPDGLIRALQLFAVVTLVAGLGILFGIPAQLEQAVLYEELDEAQALVDRVTGSIEPYLQQNIPFLASREDLADAIGSASEAVGETINDLLLTAENEAEALSPPLGTRLSRVLRQFGRWISVPFAILSNWLLLVLVAMLVAKMLGGRAALSQHMTAVLLAAAPLVLLLPSFIPYLGGIMPITFAYGIGLFSRIIALVGYAWALLILIKGLSLAHEFSWWRSASVMAVSWFVLYALLPLAGLLTAIYILPF